MRKLDHIFSRGDMYRLIPGVEKLVFPGETTEVEIRGHLESDLLDAARSPAVVNHYLFYVPFRILWTGWEEFIANADTVATVPTVNMASAQFPELGETTGTFSSLYRRAYKRIYNDYFSDEDHGTHAFYTDFASDGTQNVALPMRTVNQLLSAVALDADENLENYTVVANNIELTEFRRRLKANAIKANQKIGGEKYTDAMQRFGVQIRDEWLSRPVMIGRSAEVVYPQEVFNTSDTGTGNRVGRYRIAVKFQPKKHFAVEHGYIISLHALRPFLGRPILPLGRQLLDRRLLLEDNDKEWMELLPTGLGYATGGGIDGLIRCREIYGLGDMRTNNSPTGVYSYAASATFKDLVYPSVSGSPKLQTAFSCKIDSRRLRS